MSHFNSLLGIRPHFYPDDDLAVINTDEGRAWVPKDGRRY